MLKEFKQFISQGSAIDLAIGVVIGAAFGAIVTSLVNGIIMPLVGLVLGGADFGNMFVVLKAGTPPPPYATLAAAISAGATVLTYGLLVNAIVSFLIVAVVVFLLVKAINVIRKPAPPQAMRDCPYCVTSIPEAATRCPACTSELTAS
jgi:large conductance mechanosensitive channel